MLNSISTTGMARILLLPMPNLADPFTFAEYLQYEGTKFSKSKNVGVFGQNARETGVPASVWRYYLLANRPETSDSEFTWDDFVGKCNTELLNNFGNFVNRMIKFVNAKYANILPDPSAASAEPTNWELPYSFNESDQSLVKDVNELLASFIDQMDHQKIRNALSIVMQISGRGNLFIQENRVDNKLLETEPARCAEIVLIVINLIYLLSAIVHPFMPSTSDNILEQLNATPRSIPNHFSIDLFPGHVIGTGQHLFKTIDVKKVADWRTMYGGGDKKASATEAGAGGKSALLLAQEEKARKKLELKAKQSAKKVLSTKPRTPEQIALDEKIAVQGDVVRILKVEGKKEGGTPGSDQEKSEIAALLALKQELDVLTKSLADVEV